jgi:hypothetical protein
MVTNDFDLFRISALDPAHFGFFPPLIETSLSKNDAGESKNVHVILKFDVFR